MALQRLLIAYLLVLVVVQAFFAAVPGVDLSVSALFADGSRGFGWTSGIAPTVNLAVRRTGEMAAFLLLVGILYGAMTGRARMDHIRLMAYPLLSVALASGIMVNVLLKSHVGRARPDTLAEFGGTAQFTPPWQIVEECARNCSFASGEVAMAAALAIPAVVILWPHLGLTRNRLLVVGLALAYVAFTSVLRIGLGRHFLSDAIFSILFAAGVALALYPLLRIGRARTHLPGLVSRRPPMDLADQRGIT
ncbi:MAG: phosphatase PAP2 family protein [Paracoccaceae bacterium]|nr:MAG: phosphatase PAP2 family protein [Paracoccaceae bacterium]